MSAITCAHQGRKLDSLQEQDRLMRPPRDESGYIAKGPRDHIGHDLRPGSLLVASRLTLLWHPSPRRAGIPSGRSAPAQLGSGSSPGPQHVGLSLRPTRIRPARLWISQVLA
jgi:hypothetical protein